MKKTALTEKQRRILDYIGRMVKKSGYPPTMRQIGIEFNIRSTNGVRCHLRALVKKGFIKRLAYTSRGIELLSPGFRNTLNKELLEIPVIHRLAAGGSLLAMENIEDSLLVNKELFGGEGLFALKAQDNNMLDAGIRPGDYLIVQPQTTVEDRTCVLVLLGNEAAVKTFFRPPDGPPKLQSANAETPPILADAAQVLGRVVGLVRTRF